MLAVSELTLLVEAVAVRPLTTDTDGRDAVPLPEETEVLRIVPDTALRLPPVSPALRLVEVAGLLP